MFGNFRIETVLVDICSGTGMNEWKLVISSGIRMVSECNKVVPEVQCDHKELCIVMIVQQFSDVVEGFFML